MRFQFTPHRTGLALLAATLALTLGFGAAPAAAQTPVDTRETNQTNRIAQGTSSGALTRREQLRLQREQQRIARGETKANSDGVVTTKETAALDARQDRASRRIAHAKHDRQTQPQ